MVRSPQCRITPRFPTMLDNARFSSPQCWNETFYVVGSSSLKIKLSFIVATRHLHLVHTKYSLAHITKILIFNNVMLIFNNLK
jgi:hypothetical protein